MHSEKQLLCQDFLGDEKIWKCLPELEMRQLSGGLRKSGAKQTCQRVGISSIRLDGRRGCGKTKCRCLNRHDRVTREAR
jgi:hypothetical protein